MTNKYKILLSITGILTILLITIGLSYAYFSANLTGGEEATTITVTGGTMNIIYNGGASINVANIIPNDNPVAIKTFTVTGNNTTDTRMQYQLNLIVESNTFSEEALKYKLISTNNHNNGTVVSSINEFKKISSGTKKLNLGVGEFNSPTSGNKTHTYNLEIYFPNANYNQNVDQGKEIKAYIEIINYNGIPLNDYIIDLANNSATTGVYNEKGFRYEGANPNNYLRFNNELWRIIGVFDNETHNKINQNLVKIIREDALINGTWNNDNSNNWNSSTLKSYLNEEYYNQLDEISKNMIENITWKLGGHNTPASVPEIFYYAERSSTVYNDRPISGEGYIGLMYSSDYGYGALASTCPRDTYLYNYDNEGCKNNNWLYKGIYEWKITHHIEYENFVFFEYASGSLGYGPSQGNNDIRPVLYLKSNIDKISGIGSYNNPYEIMEK